MFVPPPYREPDGSWPADLIRANPLALLVSNGAGPDSVPYATHLPVIPDPDAPADGPSELAGATLLGHMNRANPHWAALRPDATVLLTFTGPHAYVSPTVYGTTPAAPTWDFTSVHVHGTLEKIEEAEPGEETLHVVKSTVRAFEKDFGADWDMTGSISYFRQIMPAVGAFRFTVTGADGMFKLSQEQRPEIRDRVRRSFGESACTRHRETAELIGRLS
ncbi:FMN-binding negative transcriptional regulator [Streptomyces sp. NPDC048297]|uniref:FMN-binding negative transcriptional regulator n=1 Tax=Streptomyces sp. NPDC048297 TaxID=3365531 RepID=UPI003717A327